MSAFDMAVGFDVATLNASVAAVYQKVYPQFFTGSQQVSQFGVDITVSWQVASPPTFVIPPQAPSGTPVTIQVLLSDVMLTVSSGSISASDTASVVVTIQVQATAPVFQVVAATATCKTSSDTWLINQLIMPQAITLANTMLAEVTLPPLLLPGIQLTPPAVAVQGNQIILVANLAGAASPAPPTEQAWPASDFFVLLSNAASLALAKANTSDFAKTIGPIEGKISVKIGLLHPSVSFGGTATLSNLQLSAGTAGATSFGFTVKFSGIVDAKLKVVIDFHVEYRASANNGPSGTITLSTQGGNQIVASVSHLNDFIILLTPTGDVEAKILSAITYPVTEAALAAFSPQITKALEGTSFVVWTVPSIPIQQLGLTLEPANLVLGTFNSLMSVTGSVNVV